jgi:hypothetical protein
MIGTCAQDVNSVSSCPLQLVRPATGSRQAEKSDKQDADLRGLRQQFTQKAKPLGFEQSCQKSDACEITAWSVQAFD